MVSLINFHSNATPGGSICGRLTEDLPLGCLQGGALILLVAHVAPAEREENILKCFGGFSLEAKASIWP